VVCETCYQNGIFLINAGDIVNGHETSIKTNDDNLSGSPIVLFAGMGKLPNLNMDYEDIHRVYYYLTFIYFAPGDTIALHTPTCRKSPPLQYICTVMKR
jgi:hypothetical protein